MNPVGVKWAIRESRHDFRLPTSVRFGTATRSWEDCERTGAKHIAHGDSPPSETFTRSRFRRQPCSTALRTHRKVRFGIPNETHPIHAEQRDATTASAPDAAFHERLHCGKIVGNPVRALRPLEEIGEMCW